MPEENISLQKTFNAVDQTDLIIHANINKFVTRALSEIDGFADKTYSEQEQIMQQYAAQMKQPLPPTPLA